MKIKLEQFLSSLIDERIIFFPVRHHSPACSWYLRQIIRREKPDSILVEGAEDITQLIPLLIHEKAKTPFAVYTTYVSKTNENSQQIPNRFYGYYPFCDYSPELVALREGHKINAKLKFIDLTFPEQIINETNIEQQTQARSGFDESYLKHSEYLNTLAKKIGCRDSNELWDTLFETEFWKISSEDFIKKVAAYCFLARQSYSQETLEKDGTLAREKTMAAYISDELKTDSKILVVTGGFHTAHLPELIKHPTKRPKRPKLSAEEAQTVIVRYSFDQLDSLNGYSAGMPSPKFYQVFWENMALHSPEKASLETISKILVEIGRLSREKNLTIQLSTADEIAALTQVIKLAQFRGHPDCPTREDLLDGIRSCFVKGSLDSEGKLLLDIVFNVLAGNEIGEVPPGAAVPPLVTDFRNLCAKFRLKVTDSNPKEISLDVYRQALHREISRFFYSLKFLNVYFCFQKGGADFSRGTNLERRHEIWEYRWTPAAESHLIERSLYGSTIKEAALALLLEQIAKLESVGKGRSAIEAVKILVSACQMGLHKQISNQLIPLIVEIIAEDSVFISLAEAANELNLLRSSRESLEVHQLPVIIQLIENAYQRTCFLIPNLANCPENEQKQVLNGLMNLKELMVSAQLDGDLFFDNLRNILINPLSNQHILGGVYGLLFKSGQIPEQQLLQQLKTSFISVKKAQNGFLSGLLTTSREVVWTLNSFLESLNQIIDSWNDDEFLKTLPELRLAFSNLTPRETDRTAQLVANIFGQKTLQPLHSYSFSEQDLLLGIQINKMMQESLQNDGLEGWL